MPVTRHLKRFLSTGQEKDQPLPLHLASTWGLPSQYLSILLVRSYRTFAPLPQMRRYFSVALSSRSPALGVTQQVQSLGSSDFPQTIPLESVCNHLAYSFYSNNCSLFIVRMSKPTSFLQGRVILGDRLNRVMSKLKLY